MTTTDSTLSRGASAQNPASRLAFALQGRRMAVGGGLASIAAIHVLDLPGKLHEAPYLGVAYIVLIIAALIVMERLFTVARRADYGAAALLSGAVLLAFIVNRTVGMPGATEDIGNWLEPLGLLSLVVEALVLWQSVAAVVGLTVRQRPAGLRVADVARE